jgi:hypothetical protein
MIAARGPAGRDWSAWLENEPRQACGGMTAILAIRRWLLLNRERFPGPYAVVLEEQQSSLDRVVVRLTTPAACGECGGSGKYVGLNLVEACKGCDGTGVAAAELPAC